MAIEALRGCGLRKIHGTYLVGNYIAVECDRLPLPLTSCPVCGAGVHFTRSIIEIDPLKLFGIHDGCVDKHQCKVCQPKDAPAYLMMVGEKFYSPEAFITEAITQGISKRIPFIPRKLKLGETVVYLAHKKACSVPDSEAEEVPAKDQPRLVDTPKMKKALGIFCAFIPQRIERLFFEDEITDELKEEMAKRKITIVPVPTNDKDYKKERKEMLAARKAAKKE